MTDVFLDARVLAHATTAPEAPAVGVPGRWLTYGELAATVRRLTASLQVRGVGPGDFVLNVLPAGIASVAAAWLFSVPAPALSRSAVIGEAPRLRT